VSAGLDVGGPLADSHTGLQPVWESLCHQASLGVVMGQVFGLRLTGLWKLCL